MKRITLEEAGSYERMAEGEPITNTEELAYTLTPCSDPKWKGWEEVTYYKRKRLDPPPNVVQLELGLS